MVFHFLREKTLVKERWRCLNIGNHPKSDRRSSAEIYSMNSEDLEEKISLMVNSGKVIHEHLQNIREPVTAIANHSKM